MKIKDLLMTEREQLMNTKALKGLGKFLKSNFSKSGISNFSHFSPVGGQGPSIINRKGVINVERVEEEEHDEEKPEK